MRYLRAGPPGFEATVADAMRNWWLPGWEGQYAYFGCTFWLPSGVPGGGITLSRPPPGGVTCLSLSNPAGGQITPLDCASLSLKGPELEPSPTVGGSPLASGGHATPGSGATRPWGADCASAELAIVTPPIIEMSKSLIGLHAGTHFDHAACSYSVAQAHHAFYLGAMLAAEVRCLPFRVRDRQYECRNSCRSGPAHGLHTRSCRMCGLYHSWSLRTPCRSRFRTFRI